MVAPGAAFALSPCGWAAGGVVTHVLSTGWGTGVAWHSVLLKQPGVPALLWWQKAHTGAFSAAVMGDVWS